MASVQAEDVVGSAEVVDADVAVVPGFEVLLRFFADHGVCPPVVFFAFVVHILTLQRGCREHLNVQKK